MNPKVEFPRGGASSFKGVIFKKSNKHSRCLPDKQLNESFKMSEFGTAGKGLEPNLKRQNKDHGFEETKSKELNENVPPLNFQPFAVKDSQKEILLSKLAGNDIDLIFDSLMIYFDTLASKYKVLEKTKGLTSEERKQCNVELALELKENHNDLYNHLNSLLNKKLCSGHTILECQRRRNKKILLPFLSQFDRLMIGPADFQFTQMPILPKILRERFAINYKSLPNRLVQKLEVVPSERLVSEVRLLISEIVFNQSSARRALTAQGISHNIKDLMNMFLLSQVRENQECVEEICEHIKFLLQSFDGSQRHSPRLFYDENNQEPDQYEIFKVNVSWYIFDRNFERDCEIKQQLIDTFRQVDILADEDNSLNGYD